MKICSKCGATYNDGFFCSECGGKLVDQDDFGIPAFTEEKSGAPSREYGVIEEPSLIQFVLIGIIVAAACVAASVMIYLRGSGTTTKSSSAAPRNTYVCEASMSSGEGGEDYVLQELW